RLADGRHGGGDEVMAHLGHPSAREGLGVAGVVLVLDVELAVFLAVVDRGPAIGIGFDVEIRPLARINPSRKLYVRGALPLGISLIADFVIELDVVSTRSKYKDFIDR